MFGCKGKGKGVVADSAALKLGYGETQAQTVKAAAADDPPEKAHVCEAVIKLALKEYDERRAEVLKDWKGIENPYRIRRDEALGVFLVERAEESLPWTSERAVEWGREAATRALITGWKRPAEREDYALEHTITLLGSSPPPPRVNWKLLGPGVGFSTFDAARAWLLRFIDPAYGTTEFTADGFPATAPKAAPKSRPRKG